MVAEFRGSPPHDLGTAVLALARALGENIEISLHLLDDWHRPTAQIVRVEMEPSVARALAERLTALAAEPAADARARPQ
jgi:predicted transcriptional regulator YheO